MAQNFKQFQREELHCLITMAALPAVDHFVFQRSGEPLPSLFEYAHLVF